MMPLSGGVRGSTVVWGDQSAETLLLSVLCSSPVWALLAVALFRLSSAASAQGMEAFLALDLMKRVFLSWVTLHLLPAEDTLLLHPSWASHRMSQRSVVRAAQLWENHMPTLLKLHRGQI